MTTKILHCFIPFLIFIMLLHAILSHAATYYVRNNNCSDLNPGTESLPWCYCPGMPSWTGSAKLNPGDTVFFHSGGVWVQTGNYVLNITGGVSYIGDTWGTGTRAKLVAGGDLGYGSTVHFAADHPTFPTVVKGFEIDAGGNNATASCPRTGSHYANDGINMNHLARNWFPRTALTGAAKRIENCVVYNTWSCTASNEYMYGIMIRSEGGASYTVSNVEIINNIVYNQSRTAITIYPYWDVGSKVSNVSVRGNIAYNTAQEPGYASGWGLVIKDNVADLTAEYNYFFGNHGSMGGTILISSDISGVQMTGLVIRHNILGTTSSPNHVYIASAGNKGIDFYGNIIYSNSNHRGLELVSNLTNSINLKVYNNTFYNTTVNLQTSNAAKTIAFRNNILFNTGGPLLSDPNGYIGVNHSNNIYFRSDGGTLVSSGGSNYTSANLTSYEATGLSNNPLFVNSSDLPSGFTGVYGGSIRPNTDGLSLQIESPARDTGTDLGNIYNSSINSITRPYGIGWDRGAYEVGVQEIPPVPPTNLRIIRQ